MVCFYFSKSGEVTNYYHDFWSNNIVPQKRGIALLEYRIEDDIVQTENDASDDPQQDHGNLRVKIYSLYMAYILGFLAKIYCFFNYLGKLIVKQITHDPEV